MLSAHMRGIPPPVAQSATPPAPQNHPRDTSRGAWWCGGHSGAVMFGHTLPCHCEGVRSTLETLAYDCGNPGQYVCGRSPAALFYLLDRHASLAMTRGSKGVFLNALTTPPCGHLSAEGNFAFLNSLTTPGCAHPSNGGELIPRRDESQVPLCGGVAALWAPRKCNFRG